MSGNIGGGRPVRFCPVCKQADDHPHHLWAGEPDEIARHMDCCREAGCPDGRCDVVTAGAEDKRGADLADHVTALHESEDVPALIRAHQEANPHQDPTHPSFRGFPTTYMVAGPVNLQGVDR